MLVKDKSMIGLLIYSIVIDLSSILSFLNCLFTLLLCPITEVFHCFIDSNSFVVNSCGG
jgi:hypothetical protein